MAQLGRHETGSSPRVRCSIPIRGNFFLLNLFFPDTILAEPKEFPILEYVLIMHLFWRIKDLFIIYW